MTATTLLKIQYGSRLYGTNLPTSDQDFKSVFLPDLRYVMLGKRLKTIVSNTSDDNTKNSADDIDSAAVPFQTFAEDFYSGQAYALEIAWAIQNPDTEIEFIDPNFRDFVWELVTQFSTSDVRPMIAYAWNQAQKYANKGARQKVFEDLKIALLNFLSNRKPEDVKVQELYDNIDFWQSELYISSFAPYVQKGVITQPGKKDIFTIDILGKRMLVTTTLVDIMKLINKTIFQYGHRVNKAATDETPDWKSMYHAHRIARQAYDLLTTGEMKIPLNEEDRNYLLQVRQGQLSLEQVVQNFTDLVASIDAILANPSSSKLKQKTPELNNRFEEFLFNWIIELYNNEWQSTMEELEV